MPSKPADNISLALKRSQSKRLNYAEDALKRYVVTEALPVGTILPSYKELGIRFGVGSATVQRAVANLTASGILRSEPRRGTFVATKLAVQEPAVPLYTKQSTLQEISDVRPLSIGIISKLPTITSGNWDVYLWDGIIMRTIEWALSRERNVTMHYSGINQPDGSQGTLDEAIQKLLEVPVDGLLLSLVDGQSVLERLSPQLSKLSIALVLTGDEPMFGSFTNVYFGNVHSGYIAGSHVIAQGYRKIVFASPFRSEWASDRLIGVQRAIKESIEPVSINAYFGDCAVPENQAIGYSELGAAHADQWMPELDRGSAVIAANDHIALAVMQAGEKLGLTVGRDYGLMGFDDQPSSRLLGITSIHPPIDQIAQEAVRLLLYALRTGDRTPRDVRISSYLIPRASTAPNTTA